MKQKLGKYWKIFTSMFLLSAFTFGGGYVIISLMKTKFVDELHWMDEEEMLNSAAIAQSSPGAVAVNAAILVGYRMGGMPGALVSIAGTVLPPLLIISAVSFFYNAFRSNPIVQAVLKGMQAGVAAVICDVVINMGGNIVKNRQWISILVMLGAFAATFLFKVNVLYIILTCGVIGALQSWLLVRKEREK